MIAPSPYRLKLMASMIALLMLSACQPSTPDTLQAPSDSERTDDIASLETPEVVTADDAVDPHAGHDMNAMQTQADTADSEIADAEILEDYKKSMTRMHDEMMIGMNYNDPDTAFAKGMLGHHRGALDMAKIELKYGTNPEMRKLAEDIISAQQSEIAILNKWLASHPDASKPKPNTQAMQEAYANIMETMHGDMILGIADPQPDMAFARGMLPHHIGAVDMAMVQLKYGTDEEMQALAQQIIDAQQPQIEMMQDWIAINGADALEPEDTEDAPVSEDNASIDTKKPETS